MDKSTNKMDNLILNGAVFKCRDSSYFEKALFINEGHYLSSLRIPEKDLAEKNKALLKELLETTHLDLAELKNTLGACRFYNLLFLLYAVNTALKGLMEKNSAFRNYILETIAENAKNNLFSGLDKHKIERILSLFSEILSINAIMAGRRKFIVSGDRHEFRHKRDGAFDLVLQETGKSYFFDVKRITLSSPLGGVDELKLKQWFAEKLSLVYAKGRGIDRPLIVLLDCSEIAVTEECNKAGAFLLKCNTGKIKNALELFFKENSGKMKEIENIGGVILLYWYLAVTENKEGNKHIDIVFHCQPYTNPYSQYSAERNEISKTVNILRREMLVETLRLLRDAGGEFKFLLPNITESNHEAG
ncbi:MAG: hypothetical protein KJ955_05345 [Nanoarchaeota archaeon]|nr:hypothetical protein [Nanoarchaeota archaeon]